MSAIASGSNTKKSKTKKSQQKRATTSGGDGSSGKNEGRDLNWEYQPPPGAEPIDSANEEYGEFDWDAVNEDEDVEIWVMRVPENVKQKYLEGLSFDLDEHTSSPSSPPRKQKRRTALVGSLKRKHNSYDIWSLGDDHDEDQNIQDNGLMSLIGGDEMRSLSCLLPRKSKKGQLYPAPKPIARHIIVSAQPPLPSTTTDSSSPEATFTRPPREKYSPELLTYRFMPYGSLAKTSTDNGDEDENVTAGTLRPDNDAVMVDMNTDMQSDIAERGEPVKRSSSSKKKKATKMKEEERVEVDDKEEEEERKETKSKKRKGEEGTSPKKAKKTKTTSA